MCNALVLWFQGLEEACQRPQPVLMARPHCGDSSAGGSSSAPLCALEVSVPPGPLTGGWKRSQVASPCTATLLGLDGRGCVSPPGMRPLSQHSPLQSLPLHVCGGRGSVLWRPPGQPTHSSEVVPPFHFLSVSFTGCHLFQWGP